MLLVLFYELSIGKGFDNVCRVLGITPNSDVHCTCTLGNDAHEVQERHMKFRAANPIDQIPQAKDTEESTRTDSFRL